MTLQDVFLNLPRFPDESCIYAAKIDGAWQLDSIAAVEPEPDNGALKQTWNGTEMDYLIEVFLAAEIIQVWRNWRGNDEPNPYQMLDAINYYREHDAYMPV